MVSVNLVICPCASLCRFHWPTGFGDCAVATSDKEKATAIVTIQIRIEHGRCRLIRSPSVRCSERRISTSFFRSKYILLSRGAYEGCAGPVRGTTFFDAVDARPQLKLPMQY